jgi:hypothetical protein
MFQKLVPVVTIKTDGEEEVILFSQHNVDTLKGCLTLRTVIRRTLEILHPPDEIMHFFLCL